MQFWSQLAASVRFGLVGAFMLAAISLAAFAQSPRLDVVYVPTPHEVVARMLEMAEVKPGEFVIDLGSGDGRIAVAAGKLGATALGVDIDPQRVEEGRANARREGVEDRVQFRVENLYHTDLSKADVLTMYLLDEINYNLRPKILSTMRPGARVTSHAFDMGEWTPDREDRVGYRRVFLWVVPAKVAGNWTLTAGAFSAALTLEQRYQELSGDVRVNGVVQGIADPILRGTDIAFALDVKGERKTFVGTVRGDTIEGNAERSGGTAWTAVRAAAR